MTSLPYNEQIFVKETEETTRQYINRETLRRVSTPQAYKFEKLTWAYEKHSVRILVFLNRHTRIL